MYTVEKKLAGKKIRAYCLSGIVFEGIWKTISEIQDNTIILEHAHPAGWQDDFTVHIDTKSIVAIVEVIDEE